jgi:hypothetical protein
MKKELKVIKEVLEFLSKTINVEYKIISFPDEDERNLPACDVIALVGTRKVALEHTSIDSVPFQRRDNKRFNELFEPLRSKLAGKLPTPGHYQLVIPMNVIPTGVNWADVRLRICEWVQVNAPNLEIGCPLTAPQHFIREMPQGVPFEVKLYHWPGRDGQFEIARDCPTDLENQRKKVIYRALISRGTKVTRYRNSGFRTILILESNDISLANASDIGEAFINAIKKVDSAELPDEIYLVETELEPCNIHYLKFGDEIFPDVISEEPYVA